MSNSIAKNQFKVITQQPFTLQGTVIQMVTFASKHKKIQTVSVYESRTLSIWLLNVKKHNIQTSYTFT